MKKFFTSSINEFELVSNHINYMYEQFNQIQQFIKVNFPPEYHHLLAKPEKKGTSLDWFTSLDGEFQKIEDFPKENQAKLLQIYNARKHEIETKCLYLAQSEDFDKQLWASILQSAFNPNHLFLFSNGTQIVVVWGIKTNKQLDYTVPFDEYKSSIIAASAVESAIDENTAIEHDTPEVYSTEPAEVQNEISTANVENEPTPSAEAETTPEYTTASAEEESTVPEEPVETIEEAAPAPVAPKVLPVKEKPLFYRMLDGFERFFKRFWWLFLILAILIALLLFKTCNGLDGINVSELNEEEVNEHFEEITPDEPRHRSIPIDTAQFREDDESGRIIVGGLLNIAMVDKKEEFKRMAISLKQSFPDDSYEIVYFDDQTQRIQLSYPEELSSTIKNEIRTKLSSYNLLMWDESVFHSGKTTNDPSTFMADKNWFLRAIHAPEAWDVTMGDTSVCIAVIDDGFDLTHSEFSGKRILFPYNIPLRNTSVTGGGEIIHGTHVAGLALANANNGIGGAGIAPNCSFMPVQIGGDGEFFTTTDIVDAVLYALNKKADVINMSLGKYYGEAAKRLSLDDQKQIKANDEKDEEAFWKELFNMAEKNNTLIVLAGGNENLLIGLDPMQRSEQVLKVVAVNENLRKASFSNFSEANSTSVNYISAPGEKIFSTVPGNNYEFMDGTSMAAPIVTGCIALLKSVKPNITNAEVLKILHETAKPMSEANCPPLIQINQALYKIRN